MVSWTARARADLKAIHDHIAKDSPINAKRVYHLRDERVFVITVIHKRRQPSAGDIVA